MMSNGNAKGFPGTQVQKCLSADFTPQLYMFMQSTWKLILALATRPEHAAALLPVHIQGQLAHDDASLHAPPFRAMEHPDTTTRT